MHRCGLLLQMSHVAWPGLYVCLCVCLFLCWSRECVLHKRLNRSRCRFGGLTGMDPGNHVLDLGRGPPRKGAILGVVQPIEKAGSRCSGVYSKMEHSVRSNGITANCNTSHWSVSQYIVPHEKSSPPVMRLFFKILRPLVLISL